MGDKTERSNHESETFESLDELGYHVANQVGHLPDKNPQAGIEFVAERYFLVGQSEGDELTDEELPGEELTRLTEEFNQNWFQLSDHEITKEVAAELRNRSYELHQERTR